MSSSSIGDFGFPGDADDMVARPQVAYAFMAGEVDEVVDPPELPPDPPGGGGVLAAAGAAEDAIAERDNSDKALQLERFSGNKHKAFGLTPSQAVRKLRILQFEVGATQIDDVASRIAEDCVAASILWSSLPKTAQVKHAFSQVPSQHPDGRITLVESIEICRPLFEDEHDDPTEMSMVAHSTPSSTTTHRHGPYTEYSILATKVPALVVSLLVERGKAASVLQGDSSSPVVCFKCGEGGHKANVCSKASRPSKTPAAP
ncbi:hypothetical protein FOL47_008709 [Perkinsus chesapeaki]|uniref:CCHC-type domain-containing protein n=1 Tax=Perkinsus chesapeaki TaxID=330153 RepID=A0A7J6LCG6_PERCH|nr:hypothetical protein FOL47_008709 [Perkinsus chesapeaki]